MSARVIVDEPIGIVACDCLTPLGDARATAAALNAFAAGNLRGLVTDAVAAATARGRELSEQYA